MNEVNKSIEYENIIVTLNKQINDYKSTIDELNQKLRNFIGEN